MAFNKDYIFYLIESITGKMSIYTGSCKPKKKFSDVAQYVREAKLFGNSLIGRAVVDTDTGVLFTYRYYYDGKSEAKGFYEVNVQHVGEIIQSMQIKLKNCGAAYMTQQVIAKMEATLEDFGGKAEPVAAEAPQEDYSEKDFAELLEIIDQKIQAFGANANTATFNEIVPVKNAIEAKVNAISLAERGAYSKPMSNLNMYVNTLKTQLANPMIDVNQFVGTYVPQMQAAVAELMALVA